MYVATPHPQHEKLSLAAIAAGKHVLVEKPMSTSAAAAARIIVVAMRARAPARQTSKPPPPVPPPEVASRPS